MKKGLALITTISLVAIILTGCGEATPSDTAEVIRDDLAISIPVSGNLEAAHKTYLSFGTTGIVDEIMVNEGDGVIEGQELARLDAPSLEANVRMRQAELEMAEYGLFRTIYPHYTNTYATDLAGTWMALDDAQGNLEQAQELLEEGKIQEAQDLLGQVEESLDKAQEKSQARVWALPVSVKLAELQVDQAQAGLDMAKAELDKAIITAPFDGTIAGIEVKEGEQLSVATYTKSAIWLIDLSEIKMSGLIDEIDITMVKLGQEAIIILDALPGKELKGKVTFISQAGTVQAGVVSYKATITLENPGGELRDGMSASADIILEQRSNVLLVPNRAIRGSWENPYVEVVVNGDTEQREITIGVSDGAYTEVLSGLDEGEEVILPAVSQFPFMSFGG